MLTACARSCEPQDAGEGEARPSPSRPAPRGLPPHRPPPLPPPATATSDGAARKATPPLALGDLLLMGFGGKQVEGNDEVRSLVCDVKVGGLILFERDSRTGEARNITSPEQVHQLTSDLQALAH